jgi:RNA polymerase sigma factor for flagellar operon FliA
MVADTERITRLTGLERMDRVAMITRHLPLVRYVAGSMARHANASTILDFDDLVGYGTEGLIAAVDSFNPDYNVRFSTWAVMHIRTTIQDALRSLDPLPRSLREASKALEQAQTALANAQGEWPADADVAEYLGIDVDRLHRLRRDLSQTEVSLESLTESADDDAWMSWLDRLADDDPACSPQENLDNAEMGVILRQALDEIPERERLVVTLHYGRYQTMHDIGERLSLSESRISQLHLRALRLLRTQVAQLLEVA